MKTSGLITASGPGNKARSRIHAPHLAELYRLAADRFESLPAFATRRPAHRWEPISFRDIYTRGRAIATALIERGVRAREPVGLFSDNRVEWMLADYAIQLCGAINTPRGTDITDDEIIHIINHAGIRVAFVENRRLLATLDRLRADLPTLTLRILLEPEGNETSLTGLQQEGDALREAGDRRVEERTRQITPNDLFTIIYTSGTTGTPKGVMLSHANMMAQVDQVPIELNCTDRVLSILPIWHIFERMFEVFAISHGVCNYYTSARTLGDDLRTVEPTFMGSAPRLWESLHHRILHGVQHAHPVRRALFRIAYFLGKRHRQSVFFLRGQDMQITPPRRWRRLVHGIGHATRLTLLLPFYGFFNVAVLEAIRLKAGGCLKGTISGGGALPPEIDHFFNAIGIPVLEGYGLTETTPVVAVRTPQKLVCGTVGPPIPGTRIRIVDLETDRILYPDPDHPQLGRGCRGEIQVNGPQVMQGYYRDPETTRAVLSEDGWFRTGDIGMITFNDSLKILGRHKATIVLSNGENIEPEPIEMRLCQSPYIEQCMAVGQDAKYVGALIVPDLAAFQRDGIAATTRAELAAIPAVQERVQAEILAAMGHANEFKRYQQVRAFRLLAKPFEAGDELTTLFKLKRHVVEERYAGLIAELTHHATEGGA
jgi:long-chain acyl-CoA synthetase